VSRSPGTQTPNRAPNSSGKQRWFEALTRVEQSDAAEESGAFETKTALFGTQQRAMSFRDAYKGIQEYLLLAQHVHR